jgi:hypothetical protein
VAVLALGFAVKLTLSDGNYSFSIAFDAAPAPVTNVSREFIEKRRYVHDFSQSFAVERLFDCVVDAIGLKVVHAKTISVNRKTRHLVLLALRPV